MELKKAMNNRKSIRSYNGKPITDAQLASILTAAYESPIGMGKYDSIHLTIVTNKGLLDAIDKAGAKFFGNPSMHPLYGAPMLIVVSSSDQGNVASANVAMIIENMSLAAVEEGVGHCDIYGATYALSQDPAIVAKLNLPEGFTPTGSIILGQTEAEYSDREIPEKHKFSCNTVD